MCLLAVASSYGQEYTLLTWNLRYDTPDDSLDRWDLRKEALAKEVMDHAPRIIGIQEALVDQVEFLDASWPGYGRYGVGREDGLDGGEFSPIYFDTTVFSLAEARTIWLSETPDVPGKGWDAACERIATFAILRDKSNGDRLWVVNTHWDHQGVQARLGSALLIDQLFKDLPPDGHAIVMGDLNATPDETCVKFLRSHFMDACPVSHNTLGTYNAFRADQPATKRIDYILLSADTWDVRSYEVPHPLVGGRPMSDHFPVIVRAIGR